MSDRPAKERYGEATPLEADAVRDPPTSLWRMFGHLGPGMIIAGAVVGSGELIGTTKTGAQAGFWLLWLVIVGCVIKVFVQVEFGRYAISSGVTTMAAMNEVPGPRFRANWLLWYWLVMFTVSLGQLGGIVHGVGQAMAMYVPIDGSFNRLLAEQDAWDKVAAAEAKQPEPRAPSRLGFRPSPYTPGFFFTDDITWAALITIATIGLLVVGRYGLVQHLSTLMVVGFTGVTVFCVLALQTMPKWAVGWGDLAEGLSFRLPPAADPLTPLVTALATFGIIGMGTNELITYPYWCLEKGYARFTGRRDDTAAWTTRALGWLGVMRWDAFVSMVVYTFATVAFYLLGAAVLHREGKDPSDSQMIRTLSEMYVPVFGPWTRWLFLAGAFSVLFSTFFSATAGHTRVAADAVRVFGAGARDESGYRWWVRAFCWFFPLFSLTTCVFIRNPVLLVLASGVMQAIMLPMLGAAALWFRYRRCDPRLAPRRWWDVLLWLSALGLLAAGGASACFTLAKLAGQLW